MKGSHGDGGMRARIAAAGARWGRAAGERDATGGGERATRGTRERDLWARSPSRKERESISRRTAMGAGAAGERDAAGGARQNQKNVDAYTAGLSSSRDIRFLLP